MRACVCVHGCVYRIYPPFDCAFEVGLADGAVVYKDGGTGAVLLRQQTRRYLETHRVRLTGQKE